MPSHLPPSFKIFLRNIKSSIKSATSWSGKELHCLTLQLDYEPIIRETEVTSVSEGGGGMKLLLLGAKVFATQHAYYKICNTTAEANILNAYLSVI